MGRSINKVLVTGGAGFIGSHVVEFYSGLGKDVIVVDNLSRLKLLQQEETPGINIDGEQNLQFIKGLPGITFYEADIITGINFLQEIAQDVDLIVHTAAQTAVTTSITNPRQDFTSNALGTFNVLEAARKSLSQPIIIYCSTNKVYGDRLNECLPCGGSQRYETPETFIGLSEEFGVDLCEHTPYGCSKLTGDLYCQDYARLYGLRVGVFRMSCIYGPRQMGVEDQGWVAWFARAILEGKPITIYGDGKQVRDILFVKDLVRAYDSFANSDIPYGVYNTGGGLGNTISLLELIDLLECLTQRKAIVEYSDWRQSDQKVYISDIFKLKDDLNWEPQIGVGPGVESLVRSIRQY